MTQNLDYGNAINDRIPQTDNCRDEKYCAPTDITCSSYGGFYQWDEVMQYANSAGTKGYCPPEWHLPTDAEWQMLINYLIAGIGPPDANSEAGAKLKDMVLSNGFHALLAGFYYLDNYWAYSALPLTGTKFWTSTASGADKAFARGLNIFNPSVSYYQSSRANAFPVRCVKN